MTIGSKLLDFKFLYDLFTAITTITARVDYCPWIQVRDIRANWNKAWGFDRYI